MSIELEVNGEPAEIRFDGTPEWDGLLAALEEDLAERGWEIRDLVVDGAPADPAGPAPVDLGDGRDHRLQVRTVPSAAAVAELEAGLREALPRLREQLEELGKAFARGAWQGGLERLPQLLDELRLAVTGLRLVEQAGGAGAGTGSAERRILPLLTELVATLDRRSWVEVSDLLLYELVPLLEE